MRIKKEYLKENESLIIGKEIKTFLLGCCDCGLIHQISIKKKGTDIYLKFKRVKE